MDELIARVREVLQSHGIEAAEVQQRVFPGEHWVVVHVEGEQLTAAQAIASEVEEVLNASTSAEDPIIVVFRPTTTNDEDSQVDRAGKGRLYGRNIDQLIQLLEARSRTSDALPSLKYVEDPRASLAAIAASRHQIIYGRRGVGKTALLLEAKQRAERSGHATAWINAHVLRGLSAERAFVTIALLTLAELARGGKEVSGSPFEAVRAVAGSLNEFQALPDSELPDAIARTIPQLNACLRRILRPDIVRLFLFVDDFYLLPMESQPQLLDLMASMLRDCDGWLKVASIERLTRLYEPSVQMGLEIPHDASKIDLDVTLEDPESAQEFLERVLGNYIASAGLRGIGSIAKPEARGRLVLASGGVPRDYLNLFAASLVVARSTRALAREIGKEDVARAAGQSARLKRRDLDQDASTRAAEVLAVLDRLTAAVRGKGYTYFRVDTSQKLTAGYEVLGQIVDLRFAHLVQATISDQHRAGVKYEGYVLALSEFTDVRLKRGLNVLDLDGGRWTWRLTGQNRTMRRLTGTEFRDQLRQSPLLNVDALLLGGKDDPTSPPVGDQPL